MLKNIKPRFSHYLGDIVYGGNDGIITTFAVVAGFSGAQNFHSIDQLSIFTLLLFGLANLIADGVSMGVGNFLSIITENDLYSKALKQNKHLARKNPDLVSHNTLKILKERRYSQEDSLILLKFLQQNPDYWVEWLILHNNETKPRQENDPLIHGIATFLAFVSFGFIPLLPFIFSEIITRNSFLVSISGVIISLSLLAFIKSKITEENLLQSWLKFFLLSSLAGLSAYLVGLGFLVFS